MFSGVYLTGNGFSVNREDNEARNKEKKKACYKKESSYYREKPFQGVFKIK